LPLVRQYHPLTSGDPAPDTKSWGPAHPSGGTGPPPPSELELSDIGSNELELLSEFPSELELSDIGSNELELLSEFPSEELELSLYIKLLEELSKAHSRQLS
jgi:hypothetical protein